MSNMSNQIAGFFDDQYLWKGSIFLHENNQQGKAAHNTET